ncbi:MAG: 16S rRNA (uracil(1498)-N(3))-methyltransferase [Legionellales bacterium]|nr:16S rRNA (uracil(1498)-N(3))-methyltransferase [Legionellales bacterium]
MRTIRIYQPGTYEPGQTLELSPQASRHVGTVLRMIPGEVLTLFCGDNREFSATIASVHKHQVTAHIDDVHPINRESPRAIHLAQALSKGDRMDWVVQKAVELGVTSIIPVWTAHCAIRRDSDKLAKKQAQWQAIAVSACEQSGRNQVPVIHEVCSLPAYLEQCNSSSKYLSSPKGAESWRNLSLPEGDIALLIGPEGGLSHEEVALARTYQFIPLSLGPRILRTETAALVSLSVLQAIFGDV